MKTTIELPDVLLRKAKSRAAERGQSLKQLLTEALEEKVGRRAATKAAGEPEWMLGCGKLRRLRKETRRVEARIEEEFERIESEDRA